MTEIREDVDKKSLLSELRIDRNPAPATGGRLVKWLLAVAIAGVAGIMLWNLYMPGGLQAPEVRTAVAQTPARASVSSGVLDATGYVIARRMATVSSKVTGKVKEVLIEEGMAVEEGQILATLDDSINRAQLALSESQVLSARAAIAELEVQIQQAQLNLNRTRDLADANLISQANLDSDRLSLEALEARLQKSQRDIEVAERNVAIQNQLLEDMLIRAPFPGVVIAKAAQPGEMISPVAAGGGFTATGICTIVDMASLEVEVDVNEAYINRVYAGQPATVTLNAYADSPYQAQVIAIIPAANRNQATVRVRIDILNRDSRVLPEMGVRVSFMEESSDEPAVEIPAGVLIPEAAVAANGTDSHVWVVNDQQVSRRSVEVGQRTGNSVLIISGLQIGERVVSPLDDGLRTVLEDGDEVRVLN